ncbi:MAG: ArsB/NhaD family transporter, partial [Actinomycetota bacterium]
VALTITFVALVLQRGDHEHSHPREQVDFRPRLGTTAVAAAAVLVLALPQPALPVLAVGLVVALLTRTSLRSANPPLLAGVLAFAVLLGALARWVDLGALHTGRWATAWIAVGAAAVVNNLPAAVLLSAHPPTHPRALLLGLDLGPNLVVSGSLSAIFWLQVARANDAKPSIVRYTKLGVLLVPLTLVVALLALTKP